MEDMLLSIVLSLGFVAPGGFLCWYTVWERVRMPWYALIAISLAHGVVYYLLRVVSWLGVLPFFAIAFVAYCWTTEAQPRKLLYILLIVLIYLYTLNSFFFLLGGSAYDWGWGALGMMAIAFAATLPPMAWLLRNKIWPSLRDLDTTGIRGIWVVPAASVAINILFESSFFQDLLTQQQRSIYALIVAVGAFSAACACYFVLDMLKRVQEVVRVQENIRLVDAQLALQAKRFSEMSHHMQEARILRHDMRHHLGVLNGLLEEDNMARAKEYLREYAAGAALAEGSAISANYTADTVVRRYLCLARQQDIAMTLHLGIPEDCFVGHLDLSIVLGNLLENAYHACLNLPPQARWIHLHAQVEGAELIIRMENSDAADAKKAKAPQKVARGSGYGLLSIRAVAEKYGGIARFERQAGQYVSAVLLCRPKHAQEV